MAAIQDLPLPAGVLQAYRLARVTGEYRLMAVAAAARVNRALTGRTGVPAVAALLGAGRDGMCRLIRDHPGSYLAPLNAILARETVEGLPILLHLADARAMHSSIEGRFPFLDVHLVEFLASVPACYKVRDGYSKYLARLALTGLLPDEVVWRADKKGWVMPDRYWLAGPLRDWAAGRLTGQAPEAPPPAAPLVVDVRALNLARWRKLFPTRPPRVPATADASPVQSGSAQPR